MKNVKKIIAIALIGTFTMAMSGCNIIAKTPQGIKNSPVAKVNGVTITRKQLDERETALIAAIKQQYSVTDINSNSQAAASFKTQQQSLVDEMVLEVIFQQKAKEKKITVSDDEVNKQISQYKTSGSYDTDAKWKAALSQAGYTEESLKEDIKMKLLTSKVVDNLTKDTKISDKAIEDYYNANPLQYTEQPNTMDISHILCTSQADAQAAKARIDKGEDFATVAKAVSTDTGTKDNGGSLGTINESDTSYDASFMKAAIALKQGEVSQPVQSQYGWHIIKCNKKTEYPVKKLADVKDSIKSTLLNKAKTDAYNKACTDWKKAATIKEYPENYNN